MFTPKGDRPQWAVVYDRLAGMAVGDIIRDEELLTLLPAASEGSVRGAFHRAVREIEDRNQRTLDRVRTIGYRVVEAREHERLARGQHKRARRRLDAAIRKTRSADRSKLTREERQRIDAIEIQLGRQHDMIRRLDARVEQTEKRVAGTEKDTAALSDRIDRLNDLLRRHGITEDADTATDAEGGR